MPSHALTLCYHSLGHQNGKRSEQEGQRGMMSSPAAARHAWCPAADSSKPQ
jgi:hypothetical protein